MNTSTALSSRIKAPLYSKSNLERDDFFQKANASSFVFVYEIPHSAGIVELFGEVDLTSEARKLKNVQYITNISGIPLGFLDTLIGFLNDGSMFTLDQLSVREIENYLRDDNTTSAFLDETSAIPRIFGLVPQLKKYLMERFCRVEKEQVSPDVRDYENVGEPLLNLKENPNFLAMDLTTQLNFIRKVFAAYISPALQEDEGDVECVTVSGNWIVVRFKGACQTCGMSHTSTLNFITKIVRRELCDSDLTVIHDIE